MTVFGMSSYFLFLTFIFAKELFPVSHVSLKTEKKDRIWKFIKAFKKYVKWNEKNLTFVHLHIYYLFYSINHSYVNYRTFHANFQLATPPSNIVVDEQKIPEFPSRNHQWVLSFHLVELPSNLNWRKHMTAERRVLQPKSSVSSLELGNILFLVMLTYFSR